MKKAQKRYFETLQRQTMQDYSTLVLAVSAAGRLDNTVPL